MPTRFANTIDNDPIYALRAMCDKNGLDFTQYYAKLTDLPAAQVQADWSVSDPTSMAFIKNKPDLSVFALSSSLATVATSGSYNDLLNKPTIPAAQVQSDYGQADSNAVDFIKNKPDLSVYARSNDLAAVATTGDYDDLLNKPSIPAAQVQSDWNQGDSGAVDFIKNKPNIPAAQVQSDWNQSDSNAVDFIKNKPSIPAAQVQSDWSQSNSDAVDFIKNKPTINNVPAVESTDDGKVLKASYSGGVGTYSWENESGGGGSSNVVLTYGTSTWADFTAALATNSVIFCDAGSGRYAVLAYKAATFVEFQYVRAINDTQWPLSSNGYNCEVYKFTLDNTNAWTTSSVPVAFKPVTGNGIKLYSNANRELQFAVDIPVYTDGNNSILWLGANGSLSIASSLFASKSITKTYTSPKANGPVYTSTGSTSSTYFAIGNRYNNDCDQTFDNETIDITITGDISSSMEADRTKLIRWNSSTSLTLDGDLSVKYGLFYYDTFQTSTPFKAAAEPKLIVELKDCGTLLAANRYLSGIFMHPPLTKTVNNVIVPKGAKFLTAFYTVVGGVQYFFGAMLNPYGNANLSITSTMTGSVATIVGEAPSDGKEYVRKNGAWAERETVLFDGTTNPLNISSSSPLVLSEDARHFGKIEVLFKDNDGKAGSVTFVPSAASKFCMETVSPWNNSRTYLKSICLSTTDYITWDEVSQSGQYRWDTANGANQSFSTGDSFYIIRVTGINRIASN